MQKNSAVGTNERRYRGLLLKGETHANLRALSTVLRQPMYLVVESLITREYDERKSDPNMGPILVKMEELRRLEEQFVAADNGPGRIDD